MGIVNQEVMQMRVQIAGVKQAASGKFSVMFQAFMGLPGDEYDAGDIESAPVFTTEDDAYDAGRRALTVFESTGRFPNMCEVF